MAASPERQRAFEASRSATDDEDAFRPVTSLDALGVPSPPPFLAGGRVLRATYRHAIVPARDADVAADAFADLGFASFADLAWQERVGDRWSRAADEVQHAAPDLRDHGVGRGEAPDADHRLPGQRFDEVDDRLMAAFAGEARCRAVGWAGVHLDVEKVRHIGEQFDQLMSFRRLVAAGPPAQFLEADPQRDAAIGADGVLGDLDHLAHEAHPVLDRAAIGVGTVIVFRQQELVAEIAHSGIDIDDVEAGGARLARGFGLAAQHLPYVGLVHRLGPHIAHEADMRRHPRNAGWRQRRQAAGAVHDGRAAVPQLHAGKRPMAMHSLRHQRMRADVVVVP